jgi:hypothetical protein
MNSQTICIETNSKWFLLPGQTITISQAIYNLESFNRSLNYHKIEVINCNQRSRILKVRVKYYQDSTFIY